MSKCELEVAARKVLSEIRIYQKENADLIRIKEETVMQDLKTLYAIFYAYCNEAKRVIA